MIECRPPSMLPSIVDLFLAGGISDCPNWQARAIKLLKDTPGTVANPRRSGNFDKTGDQAQEQITWEYHALKAAKSILFWFPKESICPIALFELGAHLHSGQRLIVGTDPKYPRRFDIQQQLHLAKPGLTIQSTLEETVKAAKDLELFSLDTSHPRSKRK